MFNNKKNRLLQTSLALILLAVLTACGGSNNSTKIDLSQAYTPETNNKDFPLYSAEGLTDGLSKVELTPEQIIASKLAFQAFEEKSQTVANVSGFIVKYKTAESTVATAGSADTLSTLAGGSTITSKAKTNSALANQELGPNHLTAANVVSTLGAVSNKHGVDLTFKSQNFTGAAVLNTNQNITLNKAKEIIEEMKAADSKIEYAEPNILMNSTALPTATEIASLWGLKTTSSYGVNAQQAWSTVDGNSVVVAVVDTGYRPHVDLAGQFVMNGSAVAGYDFIGDTVVSDDGNGRDSNALDVGDSCSGSPSSWHGTHVAGTIAAASNGTGVVGVAYGAKILPVRVLGKCGGYLSDVADGIVWAAGGSVAGVPNNPNPAKVINLSLGGSSSTCGSTMKNAIDTARALGAVVVVAAGNSATNAQYATPANCAAAVTVAATDSNGLLASFSNYGALVDIAAPGVSIKSTINAGYITPGADTAYANYNGTSMATPHVAGVLALMFAKDSSLTPSLAESKLVLNTRVFSPSFNTVKTAGSGIADANKVIAALTSTPAPSPDPDPTEPPPSTPSPTVGVAKARDFNGDSISDAIWRNLKTGLTRITLLGSAGIISSDMNLSILKGKTYSIEASGDFNGDGKKDLVLRHATNGKALITLMDGANVLSQSTISTVSKSYVAVLAGDFNKDGNEDILWRSSNGVMFISYMNGTSELSRSGKLKISAAIKLQGVEDFDGDGIDDLLLRAPNGYIYTLLMTTEGAYWEGVAIASSNYQIVGIGDYTGNGVNDILFRNKKDTLLTLLTNPGRADSLLAKSATGVAANQVIQKSGDFDNDGKTDLLLRHSTLGSLTKVNLVVDYGNILLNFSDPLGTVPVSFASQ